MSKKCRFCEEESTRKVVGSGRKVAVCKEHRKDGKAFLKTLGVDPDAISVQKFVGSEFTPDTVVNIKGSLHHMSNIVENWIQSGMIVEPKLDDFGEVETKLSDPVDFLMEKNLTNDLKVLSVQASHLMTLIRQASQEMKNRVKKANKVNNKRINRRNDR